MRWVKLGTSYDIEVGAHLEVGALGVNEVQPYENYHDNEISCGATFDMTTTDVIRVTAAKKNPLSENGCGGCYDVWAGVASVPNVTLGRDVADAIFFPGGPYFAAQRAIDLGGGCTGVWTFGVMEVLPPYEQQHSTDVGFSDALVFRSFWATVDPAACGALPPAAREVGRCWDSWFSRITDQAGNVVID
jgi:hypothetical protein